jgi:hypothetical protein
MNLITMQSMNLPSPSLRLQRQDARLQRSTRDRADSCRPTLCALGGTPHAHCLCGLPMAVGATLCDSCVAEGLQPKYRKATGHLEAWDGVSYPSLRLNRPTDIPTERYHALLQMIVGPLPERIVLGPARGAQPATAGEAA